MDVYSGVTEIAVHRRVPFRGDATHPWPPSPPPPSPVSMRTRMYVVHSNEGRERAYAQVMSVVHSVWVNLSTLEREGAERQGATC